MGILAHTGLPLTFTLIFLASYGQKGQAYHGSDHPRKVLPLSLERRCT